MSANTLKNNLWNIIIIVVILLIIVAVYVILTNPGSSILVLTPDEVMEDPTPYLGETIIVDGYFYQGEYPEGEGFITTSIVLEGPSFIRRLPVNHSAVNTSGLLEDQVKYRFEGLLTQEASIYTETIILIAEDIRPV